MSVSSPIVSVIIPIYNVEKYLAQCLDSVCAQSYNALEIILVNDGSPDSSNQIIAKYAKKDKRIKVIEQKNQGVSAARNAGLKLAKGKYVVFIDADDYVANDYVEHLLRLIQQTDSPVSFSTQVFDPVIGAQEPKIGTFVCPSVEALEKMYLGEVYVAVWNKIYKKEFIDSFNIKFQTDLWYGEGMMFNVEAFCCANIVGVSNRKIYYQRWNNDSATRKFKLENWENGFLSLNKQKKLLKNADPRISMAWEYHYWQNCFIILREIIRTKSKKQNCIAYKKYRQIARKKALPLAFQVPISSGKKIVAMCISIAPNLMARIYIFRMSKKYSKQEQL